MSFRTSLALRHRVSSPNTTFTIRMRSRQKASLEGQIVMFRLDYLSCLLTILATILVGRKCWTGLVVSGVNSLIVCVIGVQTSQFGFIPANLFCICIYAVSIRSWLKGADQRSETGHASNRARLQRSRLSNESRAKQRSCILILPSNQVDDETVRGSIVPSNSLRTCEPSTRFPFNGRGVILWDDHQMAPLRC